MSTVSRTRIGRAPRSRALWTPKHPGPHRLPARHGVLWSAVLPPANQPFIDDYIAYPLVLVALPWPAQPSWRFGRAYHRTVSGAPLPALR